MFFRFCRIRIYHKFSLCQGLSGCWKLGLCLAIGKFACWFGGLVKAGCVSTNLQATLDQAVNALRTELGKNLYSCCVYGSAVRGNSIEGVSDINLLIILNQST